MIPTLTILVSLGVGLYLALSGARRSGSPDYFLPRTSVLEVVCINAILVAATYLPTPVAALLLGPFHLLMPRSSRWLADLLSFWPSLLALWAASRGAEAGRPMRFVLLCWMNLVYVLSFLPLAAGAFLERYSTTWYALLETAFVCIAAVHTLFLLRALGRLINAAVFGEATLGDAARRLAERVDPGPWGPIAYVPIGIVVFVLAYLAPRAVGQRDTAVLFAYVIVFGIGTLLGQQSDRARSATDSELEAPSGVAQRISWPVAALALLAGLSILILSKQDLAHWFASAAP